MKQAKDIFFIAFGSLIAVGTVVLIALMIIYRPEMQSVIDMCIGALVAVFVQIGNYFFGSSKGSADKNEMLMRK